MNSNHFLNTKESRSLGKKKSRDYNKKSNQILKAFSSSGDTKWKMKKMLAVLLKEQAGCFDVIVSKYVNINFN